MRQVVLDTETTGLSAQQGHRLTEVGCVELIDRRITGRTFQSYINPEREVDERAAQITGLTWEKLQDKPKFAQIADDLATFIGKDELIIHNASFDLSFLEHEFGLLAHKWLLVLQEDIPVVDTLLLARRMHPGQRNSLDALCKRYSIDNTHRHYHGALLDADILARVYLAMSSGQVAMDLGGGEDEQLQQVVQHTKGSSVVVEQLKVVYANAEELAAHAAMVSLLKVDENR